MSDKTIVFTGAMIPYEIANSDALFNFGFACGVAQTLPPGVYVAMNGTVFTWDNVTKNRAAGVFQALLDAPGSIAGRLARAAHFRQFLQCSFP